MLIVFISILCITFTKSQETLEPRVIEKVVDKAMVKDHYAADLIICNRLDTVLGMSSDPKKKALSNILGRTHDLLTDTAYYHVLTQSYSSCQKTPDFRFYVPNNYMVEMVMDREFHKSMKITESFTATKDSAHAGAGTNVDSNQPGKDIAGAASANAEVSKSTLQKEQKNEFSISVGNKMYRLVSGLRPDFTDDFKNRILPIADAIEKKLYDRARQLVERVVVDYGTHVTTEAIVGTHIEKKVYIKKSLSTKTSSFSATARAAARAELEQGSGEAGGEASASHVDGEGKMEMDMDIKVFLQGGSEFKHITTDDITTLLNDDRPVAISRKIQPLYLFMDSGSLNNCSSFTSRMLRQFFEDAINEYFERNTYRGCTNSSRLNFDYQANVDDNTCLDEDCGYTSFKCDAARGENSKASIGCAGDASAGVSATCNAARDENHIPYKAFLNCLQGKNLVFQNGKLFNEYCRNSSTNVNHHDHVKGGMYQTCEPSKVTQKHHEELKKLNIEVKEPCDGLKTKNIITSDFTCPGNQLLIHTYTYARPILEVAHHAQLCDGGVDSDHCTDIRAEIVLRDQVNLTSYWCGPNDNDDKFNFVYFAGYFDYGQVNNFNLRRECPRQTYPVTMFHATTFCIYEQAINGKNFNAQLTRVYSSKTRGARCLLGHSRQLITVLKDNTKIYACILKNQAYYDLPFPALIKGPFMNIDTLNTSDLLSTRITIYVDGKVKNSTYLANIGHDIKTYYDDIVREIKKHKKDKKEMETQTTTEVLVSFFTTKIILCIIAVVVLFFCIFVAIQCHRTRAK